MDQKSINSNIFKGTVIIVVVGVLAKLAAFIEEAVLAAYLGTTSQSDAYYMVWSVHAVIYPMMSVGIWNVFLPLYKSHISKKENDKAFELTNKSISFFTILSTLVVILLIVFAPIVVSVVAPGFKDETRALCIKLVRISAPMYVFVISSSVYASILQCHNKFLGSQIREVASHIPTVITAIVFYQKFGITAMAIALVIAGLVRLLIELPFVDWGYKLKPDFRFSEREFTVMLRRLPSALVSAGVVQLNALIDKAMASILPTGTVSALNYGNKLMNVFSGLLSTAIATALYPQMIELIALEKKDELGKLLSKIINIFGVLMLPITFACVLFRIELVSVVYERGAFDSVSTTLTSSIFALYSLGLFFVACNTVISNVFYGYGNTKTPMYISLANLGINVVLNVVLIYFLGANGLALATSFSAILTFFIRVKASRKYISLNIKDMIITMTKIVFASIIACLVPRFIFWFYPINKYILLICSAFIGLAIYLILVKVLRIKEINDIALLVKQKVKKV